MYCLSQERLAIQRQAAAVGLSVSVYLRRVGLGAKVTSIIDQHQVQELARNPRTAATTVDVNAVLAKIDANQQALRTIMTTIVKRG